MKRFMVDIESIGNQPGGVILSIGWVRFDLDGVVQGSEKEVRISVDDSLHNGLEVDGRVIEWWLDQKGSPWRADTSTQSLAIALHKFSHSLSGADQVWAKPPSYDLSAIRSSYDAIHKTPPWHHRAECCFRTLKRLAPKDLALPKMEGTKHGALDDAIQQAREAAVILKWMRDRDGGTEG